MNYQIPSNDTVNTDGNRSAIAVVTGDRGGVVGGGFSGRVAGERGGEDGGVNDDGGSGTDINRRRPSTPLENTVDSLRRFELSDWLRVGRNSTVVPYSQHHYLHPLSGGSESYSQRSAAVLPQTSAHRPLPIPSSNSVFSQSATAVQFASGDDVRFHQTPVKPSGTNVAGPRPQFSRYDHYPHPDGHVRYKPSSAAAAFHSSVVDARLQAPNITSTQLVNQRHHQQQQQQHHDYHHHHHQHQQQQQQNSSYYDTFTHRELQTGPSTTEHSYQDNTFRSIQQQHQQQQPHQHYLYELSSSEQHVRPAVVEYSSVQQSADDSDSICNLFYGAPIRSAPPPPPALPSSPPSSSQFLLPHTLRPPPPLTRHHQLPLPAHHHRPPSIVPSQPPSRYGHDIAVQQRTSHTGPRQLQQQHRQQPVIGARQSTAAAAYTDTERRDRALSSPETRPLTLQSILDQEEAEELLQRGDRRRPKSTALPVCGAAPFESQQSERNLNTPPVQPLASTAVTTITTTATTTTTTTTSVVTFALSEPPSSSVDTVAITTDDDRTKTYFLDLTEQCLDTPVRELVEAAASVAVVTCGGRDGRGKAVEIKKDAVRSEEIHGEEKERGDDEKRGDDDVTATANDKDSEIPSTVADPATTRAERSRVPDSEDGTAPPRSYDHDEAGTELDERADRIDSKPLSDDAEGRRSPFGHGCYPVVVLHDVGLDAPPESGESQPDRTDIVSTATATAPVASKIRFESTTSVDTPVKRRRKTPRLYKRRGERRSNGDDARRELSTLYEDPDADDGLLGGFAWDDMSVGCADASTVAKALSEGNWLKADLHRITAYRRRFLNETVRRLCRRQRSTGVDALAAPERSENRKRDIQSLLRRNNDYRLLVTRLDRRVSWLLFALVSYMKGSFRRLYGVDVNVEGYARCVSFVLDYLSPETGEDVVDYQYRILCSVFCHYGRLVAERAVLDRSDPAVVVVDSSRLASGGGGGGDDNKTGNGVGSSGNDSIDRFIVHLTEDTGSRLQAVLSSLKLCEKTRRSKRSGSVSSNSGFFNSARLDVSSVSSILGPPVAASSRVDDGGGEYDDDSSAYPSRMDTVDSSPVVGTDNAYSTYSTVVAESADTSGAVVSAPAVSVADGSDYREVHRTLQCAPVKRAHEQTVITDDRGVYDDDDDDDEDDEENDDTAAYYETGACSRDVGPNEEEYDDEEDDDDDDDCDDEEGEEDDDEEDDAYYEDDSDGVVEEEVDLRHEKTERGRTETNAELKAVFVGGGEVTSIQSERDKDDKMSVAEDCCVRRLRRVIQKRAPADVNPSVRSPTRERDIIGASEPVDVRGRPEHRSDGGHRQPRNRIYRRRSEGEGSVQQRRRSRDVNYVVGTGRGNGGDSPESDGGDDRDRDGRRGSGGSSGGGGGSGGNTCDARVEILSVPVRSPGESRQFLVTGSTTSEFTDTLRSIYSTLKTGGGDHTVMRNRPTRTTGHDKTSAPVVAQQDRKLRHQQQPPQQQTSKDASVATATPSPQHRRDVSKEKNDGVVTESGGDDCRYRTVSRPTTIDHAAYSRSPSGEGASVDHRTPDIRHRLTTGGFSQQRHVQDQNFQLRLQQQQQQHHHHQEQQRFDNGMDTTVLQLIETDDSVTFGETYVCDTRLYRESAKVLADMDQAKVFNDRRSNATTANALIFFKEQRHRDQTQQHNVDVTAAVQAATARTSSGGGVVIDIFTECQFLFESTFPSNYAVTYAVVKRRWYPDMLKLEERQVREGARSVVALKRATAYACRDLYTGDSELISAGHMETLLWSHLVRHYGQKTVDLYAAGKVAPPLKTELDEIMPFVLRGFELSKRRQPFDYERGARLFTSDLIVWTTRELAKDASRKIADILCDALTELENDRTTTIDDHEARIAFLHAAVDRMLNARVDARGRALVNELWLSSEFMTAVLFGVNSDFTNWVYFVTNAAYVLHTAKRQNCMNARDLWEFAAQNVFVSFPLIEVFKFDEIWCEYDRAVCTAASAAESVRHAGAFVLGTLSLLRADKSVAPTAGVVDRATVASPAAAVSLARTCASPSRISDDTTVPPTAVVSDRVSRVDDASANESAPAAGQPSSSPPPPPLPPRYQGRARGLRNSARDPTDDVEYDDAPSRHRQRGTTQSFPQDEHRCGAFPYTTVFVESPPPSHPFSTAASRHHHPYDAYHAHRYYRHGYYARQHHHQHHDYQFDQQQQQQHQEYRQREEENRRCAAFRQSTGLASTSPVTLPLPSAVPLLPSTSSSSTYYYPDHYYKYHGHRRLGGGTADDDKSAGGISQLLLNDCEDEEDDVILVGTATAGDVIRAPVPDSSRRCEGDTVDPPSTVPVVVTTEATVPPSTDTNDKTRKKKKRARLHGVEKDSSISGRRHRRKKCESESPLAVAVLDLAAVDPTSKTTKKATGKVRASDADSTRGEGERSSELLMETEQPSMSVLVE